VSEILNRRRPLTMKMARRLHEAFGIPADALIRPYDLAR
jgi:HTH-type transcriptional regulator / antitoxin HigA